MLQFTDALRETFRQKAAFAKVRKAENDYGRRLRKIANHIHDLIIEFVTQTPGYMVNMPQLEDLLKRYSNILEPWAQAVAARFLAEVARRDEQAWRAHSSKMNRALEQEVRAAPTGTALREFLATQVQLITSLPTDAAQRVHDIAIGNVYSGARADVLAQHLMETGEVTRNRATLIARTETARVAGTLTMVRAQYIGGTHYIWRTMRDSRVRDSHEAMEAKTCEWASPPEVEPGQNYHPGMTYNCRCYAEPVIPDKYL